ncbi:MAG: hypothetical protein RL122_324 [Pseudomonadota bacterium]|jgi:hypothetical protein|uniref:DUF4388 domain-containing protein n=1 Tax=Thiothrix fructosivorans TaxID=111770 RepID=A0A8B0SJV5_9GAMM|nr:hypothetical protein [Thiothrix fructosivorans]MBO0611989.1 hypothetical protein [Thiothrix fructosivorans]QTX12503.1 hypothetical protein J1836_009350 [Thiothrix fructosivorans]
MERHSSLTLAQILERLAVVLGHKQTGTFYIATDNNTSCRFGINAGKLTHCTHRRDQGAAALHSLLMTYGGSCSFSENQSIPFRADAAVDHQASLTLLGIQPIILPRAVVTPLPLPSASPSVIPPRPLGVNNRFYRGG